MHFPRYWTTARHKNISAWGWSDESLEHAATVATERLERIRAWLARGGAPSLKQRYGYADRPMREEVLREFRSPDGTLRAAITRNSYGCHVLNTSNLMFVDVDAPEAKESSFLAGLFGFRRPNRGRNPADFLNTLNARLSDWSSRWPTWGWRVYRTHSGVRLLATHQPVAPEDSMCRTAFEVFEADPLYRQLCSAQKCFRARLTPKPWRCNVGTPRYRWPWADEKTESRFRKWDEKYGEASRHYATCKLINRVGDQTIVQELRDLIALHDEATRADSDLPLA